MGSGFDQFDTTIRTVVDQTGIAITALQDQPIISAVIPIMACAADRTHPIIPTGIIDKTMGSAAPLYFQCTNFTGLIVTVHIMEILVICLVSLGRTFLLLCHTADCTSDRLDTRFRTGGCVGIFVPAVFFCFCQLTFGTGSGMADRVLRTGIFPLVFLCLGNGGRTIAAVDTVGTITQILTFRIFVRTGLHQTAAAADIANCTGLFIDHFFHLVIDGNAAVHSRNTITNRTSVVIRATTNVPALRQRISNGQGIAIFQIVIRHGLTGIIAAAANGIQPAGTTGIVKLTDGAAGCRRKAQTIAIDASPKGRQSGTTAKIVINVLQDLFFCCTEIVPPGTVECIGAHRAAGSQTPQIESHIKRAAITAADPTKGVFRGAERISGIVAPNGLGYHIGHRLFRQNGIGHRSCHAQAQNSQINIDLCCADLLPTLGSLTDKGQGQFAVIAFFIFRVDIQGMFIGIAYLGIFGDQRIFLSRSGSAGVRNFHTIQFHGDFCAVGSGGQNLADGVAVGILCPCPDIEIDFRTVGDFHTIGQVGGDFHQIVASMFIRDIDGEGIFLPPLIFCFDCKCVVTGLALIQCQPNTVGCAETDRFSGTGLVAADFRNRHTGCVLTQNRHFIRQQIVCQLIVKDQLRRGALLVFTGDQLLLGSPVHHSGVAHLQADIVGVTQLDGKGHLLILHLRRDGQGIGGGRLPCRDGHGEGAAGLQTAAARTGLKGNAFDPGIRRAVTGQFHLIHQCTGAELIVFHPVADTFVFLADQFPSGNSLFKPTELQLQIQRCLIDNGDLIGDFLLQHIAVFIPQIASGHKGQIIGFLIHSLRGLHLERTAHR